MGGPTNPVLKWLLRILAGLLVVAVVAAVGGYLWLRTSLPLHDGRLTVAGADAPVEIVRDRWGVPHIYAQTLDDAVFGLGFAHAQDRLWQMEMNRRIASGRLAEVVGAPALPADRFLRTLGFMRHAEAGVAQMAPQWRGALQSYADGVNAYLATRTGALPPEFELLRHRPEPWQPVDSAAWIKVMALNLSMNWGQELERLRLTQRLTPQQLDELFPPGDARGPQGVERHAALRRALPADLLERLAGLDVPQATPGIGSNNWVVDGRRTATGKPLLANDPHLGLTVPSIWYFARLSWPGHDVVGATFPGFPAVIIGRNRSIAWGLTNTGSDVQDLVMERLVPGTPESYQAPEGPQRFETRTERIRVRGGDDIALTVRSTANGPVISDAATRVQEAAAPGHVLALRWTALAGDDRTVTAGFELMLAHDWPSFVAALNDFHAPQQSVVYADTSGDIGLFAPARVPRRRPGTANDGFLPAPGWDAAYRWDGFIPYDELPKLHNPPGGIIATANHRIVGPDYPWLLTTDWQETYRIRRILDQLQERPSHSLESFKALQSDVTSLMAQEFLPYLLAAAPSGERAAAAQALLAGWDGAMAATRPEPLIFSAWYRELTRLVYADELGPLFEGAWSLRPYFRADALTGRNGWCDDVSTPARESCDGLVARALDLALDWIAARHGTDMNAWQWGDAHVVRAEHRPFSRLPLVGRLFEVVTPMPGGAFVVNVGRYDVSDEAEPFRDVHGPSLRAIFDLDDPDRSLFVHSTGQSGNVLSPLYDNLAPLWAAGDYIPITTVRRDAEAGALGTLTLVPR